MKHVILLSGKLRCGKNTTGEFLEKHFKAKGLKVESDFFAHDLKHGCKNDFRLITDYLNDFAEKLKTVFNTYNDLAGENSQVVDAITNIIDSIKTKDQNFFEDKTDISRRLLQIYGTEIFRNRVDPNYWANQVKNRAVSSTADVVIVTDTRFPNELEAFDDITDKDLIVHTIRIERNLSTGDSVNQHISETALDDYPNWSFIVDNNGTLGNLDDNSFAITECITNPEEVTFENFIKD
jgi:hypothetical protein